MVATGPNNLTRLPSGGDGQVLIASSGDSAGLKYAGFQSLLGVQSKGDLLVGTAPNALARLPVGGNGLVLVSDNAQETGVKWGSVSPLFASAVNTSGFETASTPYVDITSLSVSVTMPSAGTILAFASGSFRAAQVYDAASLRLMIDGTASDVVSTKSCNSGSTDISWVPFCAVFSKNVTAGVKIIKAQFANTGAGHNTVYLGNSNLIAVGFPG
jgi:hypothetical protein